MMEIIVIVLSIVLAVMGLATAYVLALEGTTEDIHDSPFRFDDGSEYRKEGKGEE